DPLYTDGPEHLGQPGVEPFTRGAKPPTGDVIAWDVAQFYEGSDAKATNAALLTDLNGGATSALLRVDADAVAAADIATVLNEVMLDIAAVRLTSVEHQWEAAQA